MWTVIARIILRQRVLLLWLVGLSTAFMAWQTTKIEVSYNFSRILPQDDSTHIEYEDFKATFGEVANTVVIGIQSDDLFQPHVLLEINRFTDTLRAIAGIEQVVSLTRFYDLEKDSTGEIGVVLRQAGEAPGKQEANALREKLKALPFYDDLLISRDRRTTLLFVQLDIGQLYNAEIIRIVEGIKDVSAEFEERTDRSVHISGLPHIRMANTTKIKNEVYLFIILALAVTALLLLIFLRSFRATGISMLVVIFGVIWSFGLISLFGFSITLVSSIIPPLVIVIGIPNCIFLINKFHHEYKDHGNKVLALQRKIRKIGNATLLTNVTTGLGFASFTLTESVILKEFGVVAFVNILAVYLLSIILIPILYSYLKEPKERHYAHLDRRWVSRMNGFLIYTVAHRRPVVYVVSAAILIAGFFGIQRIETTGNLTDDFQRNDPVYLDLKFLEKQFRGVVPIEVVIESRREGGIRKLSTLKRMERFQRRLDSIPLLSRSLAITDLTKFARQGFYSGDPRYYDLVNSQDRQWVFDALPKGEGYSTMLQSLVDSTSTKARIGMQVADIGTKEMRALEMRLQQIADEVFESERYDVTITGASVLFLHGTTYLIKNLIISLLLAILVISVMMAFLFRSLRMVIISLLPNLLPLVLTAAIMGFMGIPLKPSTILVFSIAFGISVDDTIHFLAKYRQELQRTRWDLRESVVEAIRETSVSMFYTSVVLFFGFSIFLASEFGGTQALGALVSITLFLAMFSNLIILPSLLLTLDRFVGKKSIGRRFKPLKLEESDPEEVK